MNLLKVLAAGGATLAAVVLVVTLLASVWLGGRAEAVQRVVPHDAATAALLGEVGTPVGRVDNYIILNEGAFLDETTDAGAQLVSETFLKENNVYPLQLKTVTFLRNLVAAVSLAALLLLGGLWLWLRRRGEPARANA